WVGTSAVGAAVFVRIRRPAAVLGPGRRSLPCTFSTRAGSTPYIATDRASSPLQRDNMPYLAPQIRTAFRSIASNTGLSSPGELEITCRTSELAVCCSSASASSRVRASSCFFNSISVGLLLTRVLVFVPVERSLRPRVGLFAPLRDKVTSSAQPLAPVPVGPAKDRAYQS